MRASSGLLEYSADDRAGGLRLFLRVTVFVILAALYVFKYDGNDYSMYENYYELGTGFEIGYELLAALSRAAGFDFKYFYGM